MKTLLLFLLTLIFSSCGKTVNNQPTSNAYSQDLSFILMEHQCANGVNTPTNLFKNIQELLQNAVKTAPPSMYSKGVIAQFDSAHPMVVSIEGLQNEYNQIASNPSIHSIDEIMGLYSKAQRFEDLKCSLGSLSLKQNKDLRPYFNLIHNCIKENPNANGDCTENEYQNNPEVVQNVLSLCEAFYSKGHCLAEFKLTKNNNNLTLLVQRYRQKFSDERVDTLFQLRDKHLTFNCLKEDSQTNMHIKIFAPSIEKEQLSNLLAYAEKQWKSESFSMKFEIVDNSKSSTVQIISITNGISNVPDDHTNILYLNTTLDMNQMSRVLAHEFGHVLGFPDCYIEFFDTTKKELIYYEIAEKNMNIMCSMKYGVTVPKDYFAQLEQRSCNFR
jgi:galactitol-specific phosphotransferase system IIB component